MRFRYVLALLLLIPLADALFLVVVAGYIGALPTVALVVLTALIGMLLVRAEGRHTLRRIQRKAARGEPPTDELMDGAMLIAAGAFLLTPGLVTDALGILFTIPITRYPIRAVLKRYVVIPALDREMDGFVTGRVWTSGFPNDVDFQTGDRTEDFTTDPFGEEFGQGEDFDADRDDVFSGVNATGTESADHLDESDSDVVDVDFDVDSADSEEASDNQRNPSERTDE